MLKTHNKNIIIKKKIAIKFVNLSDINYLLINFENRLNKKLKKISKILEKIIKTKNNIIPPIINNILFVLLFIFLKNN